MKSEKEIIKEINKTYKLQIKQNVDHFDEHNLFLIQMVLQWVMDNDNIRNTPWLSIGGLRDSFFSAVKGHFEDLQTIKEDKIKSISINE